MGSPLRSRRSRDAPASGSAPSTATSRTGRRWSRRSTSTRSRRCAGRRRELDGADPWEALNGWVERFIGYLATKRALAHELLNYLDQDASLFQASRASLFAAGEPLLERAQEAGVVRQDVTIAEVIQMVVGIAKIPAADPSQTERILRIALDGLRYRPEG